MLPPIRVLIAEDHDDTREGYALYLEQQGMDVRTARDGLTALRIARRWKPDVAVLDLSMPRVTGDEVARAIRKHRVKGVAIIVVSGFAAFGEKRAMDAGADRYLTKPLLPHELATIVRELAGTEVGPDEPDESDEPTEESA
jgi:two-component system OmpR family response regulator